PTAFSTSLLYLHLSSLSSLFLPSSPHHPALHSFPTRRSSDLVAECLRLPPVHVQHRAVRFERHPLVEIPAQPASRCLAFPVHRMPRAHALAPAPTRLAPEFPPVVPLLLDEFQKLHLCHRRSRDRKRFDRDGVRPLLVVKNKRFFVKRPQAKPSSRNLHISAERPSFAGTP